MENMKEKTLASTTGKVACFSHFCANVVLQGKDGRVFGKRSEFGFETTKKEKTFTIVHTEMYTFLKN